MTGAIINVHIGKVCTGNGDEQLQTILGSCIGIGFLWQKRGLYGLAHCLLPIAPEGYVEKLNSGKNKKNQLHAARYVDQAIDSLTNVMSITDYRDIRAIVAGGANMTLGQCDDPKRLVGYQNALSAQKQIEQRKIILVKKDTGGNVGRKIIIDCDSGEYDIAQIPRIEAP